jgi:putative OPT family oligopeptide transporter
MIILSAIISCAAAITTDTIQDLKAGKMVGATPWKQQVMLILGVLASALVIPLILELLFNAYGMAGVYPRPGMDPSQSLSAPQAAMMAIVTQAVFSHQLPWALLWTGFGIAFACLIANHFLKRKGLHVIVLAIGLGIYLPLDSTTPMVLGSFITYIVSLFYRKKHQSKPAFFTTSRIETHKQKALLLACGMVAGSALMGVILAIPFALSESTDVLSVISETFTPYAIGFSIVVTVGLLYWLYYAACHCGPDEK